MNRQLMDNMEEYFHGKKKCTRKEKNLLEALQREKESFDIASIDRAAIARNGFCAVELSDSEMEEIAGLVGDYYCGSSKFDYDLQQACQNFGLKSLT